VNIKCTNDGYDDGTMYETAEECCSANFADGEDCKVVDICNPTSEPTMDPTPAPVPKPIPVSVSLCIHFCIHRQLFLTMNILSVAHTHHRGNACANRGPYTCPCHI
jgi:hypothetical protein